MKIVSRIHEEDRSHLLPETALTMQLKENVASTPFYAIRFELE